MWFAGEFVHFFGELVYVCFGFGVFLGLFSLMEVFSGFECLTPLPPSEGFLPLLWVIMWLCSGILLNTSLYSFLAKIYK